MLAARLGPVPARSSPRAPDEGDPADFSAAVADETSGRVGGQEHAQPVPDGELGCNYEKTSVKRLTLRDREALRCTASSC